ncbi:MAG: lasso peptide biosynthesis B2 protein [Brevundimonas sp.]|uniref:lasso peptide biosynthesis B2 protein n=1 Tax=Brevundimonas sp. TaxID=1871086 RepID=UPI002732E403|nr:lasso peptide biosynthesis B2 protein [Brevundimonas sp.]MDP3406306.1 lasso peptide biosynthesis B2 protein [Brevundimonas sp.]
MVRLWCPSHIHLAALDEDIIVLDVAADRYSCLLEANAHLSFGPAGAILAADEEVAESLLGASLASRSPCKLTRPAIIPARREVTPSATPTRSDVLRAAIVLLTATLAFRRKSFSELLRPPAFSAHASEGADAAALGLLLGAARTARPWVPNEGECLQRAYLLRAFLAGRGVRTDWIFGVRTWPFSAHCWLQIGDLVVGDRLDRVNRYTPIMRA